jgi:hypothetical protein
MRATVRTSDFIQKSKKAEEEKGLEVVGKERGGKEKKRKNKPSYSIME